MVDAGRDSNPAGDGATFAQRIAAQLVSADRAPRRRAIEAGVAIGAAPSRVVSLVRGGSTLRAQPVPLARECGPAGPARSRRGSRHEIAKGRSPGPLDNSKNYDECQPFRNRCQALGVPARPATARSNSCRVAHGLASSTSHAFSTAPSLRSSACSHRYPGRRAAFLRTLHPFLRRYTRSSTTHS